MMLEPLDLSVSEFVELLNQTLESAYSAVSITGELANLRVSKNRWVYFDLKDEHSTVKFFGSVYQLPGPLEDGMILKVRGQPKLHNLYGFSVTIQSIRPAGEGTIKRAAELLQAKLAKEGLFDDVRKRRLPYPPSHVGLIASQQSAAYADFIKIINARWGGLKIEHIDVQVQGEPAPEQIVSALEQFNAAATPPEIIIIIRGGGSAEDLAAFNTEQVTRAVGTSRVPTMAAIGHEVDWCLAELAADCRASTPSNAAELLVPDKFQLLKQLDSLSHQFEEATLRRIQTASRLIETHSHGLDRLIATQVDRQSAYLRSCEQLLVALSPEAILRRGYAIVRRGYASARSVTDLTPGAIVDIQVADGHVAAQIAGK